MITLFLALFLVVVLAIEYLLYKERTKFEVLLTQAQNLNTQIELVKSFAYLSTVKNQTFEEITAAFSSAFFAQQNKYDSFTVKITKEAFTGPKIIHFHIGLPENHQNFVVEENDLLKSISIPLVHYGKDWGNVVFYKSNPALDANKDMEFLGCTSNILTTLIRRFEFDDLLSLEEQVKAVSVKW